MNPITSEHLDIEPMPDKFPDDLCLIVGAGHFGKRAAQILKETSDSPILIIDKDKDRIDSIEPIHTKKIVSDGVNFLVKNIQSLNPSSVIVPAIPVHLASEWLKIFLEEHGWEIQPIRVPEEIIQSWRPDEPNHRLQSPVEVFDARSPRTTPPNASLANTS